MNKYFCWVKGLNRPYPEIWYHFEPHVVNKSRFISRMLVPTEDLELSLDQLAVKYPCIETKNDV